MRAATRPVPRPAIPGRGLRIAALATAILLAGCAYTFNPSLPSHLKTLQIPVVENQTLEVALPEALTSALTDRFVANNQLRVVQKDADAVLEADITGYENRVFGFNAEQQAQEYIVLIAVKMTLRDRVKGKDLWSEENVRGVASYYVGGAGQTVTTEEGARVLAIKQIVDFALSRTVEGW
jgi:outer membrane lipopolysaccharide assembly protein LptE/RlpB